MENNTTALEFLERIESETTDKFTASKIRKYLRSVGYWDQPQSEQTEPASPTEPTVFNAVACLVCGEIIESRHRHDYKTCGCSNEAMVDGGLDYARYGAKNMKKIIPIIYTTADPHETVRKHVSWGTYGKDGQQPLSYVKIQDMSDEHIQAILDTQRDRMNPGLRTLMEREQVFRQENSIAKPEVV